MRREIKWRPLLTGILKKRALEALDDINIALQNCTTSDGSLAGGSAGIALFYHYMAQFKDKEKNEELSSKYLDDALETVANHAMSASLFEGFTGIAWTCEHLDANVSGDSADSALLTWLKKSKWKHDYDLISGLVGIGVYAIERLPDRIADGILKQVVEHLRDLSHSTSDGISWHTSPELLPEAQRVEFPTGYFNLGVAHGIPGVIAILGSLSARKINVKTSRKLLEGAFEWMFRQKLATRSVSMYSWDAGSNTPARAAWCYGDPGIAASLFLAASCIKSNAKKEEALKIAHKASKRTPANSGIKDAGLCHGSSGLGHIFNRIFQTTGNNKFRKAARFWFQETLKMRRNRKGIGGFSAFSPTEGWVNEPGFLNGSAGIGLALLSAVSHIPPDWDRILLLSTKSKI